MYQKRPQLVEEADLRRLLQDILSHPNLPLQVRPLWSLAVKQKLQHKISLWKLRKKEGAGKFKSTK
jgi:hypothetical protein